MKNSKQIWVSPNHWNQWKVKQPDNKKASAIVPTKKEAVKIAEVIAKHQWLETKIQKKDGTIQGGNSYGKDSCPPKDKNK